MKYTTAAVLGMVATTVTYLASVRAGVLGAMLLLLSLFLWLAFIVAIVRALKPE